VNEHEFEPVRGLPAALPPGESLLWQGSPHWQRLAVEAFHVRKVAAYFALLAAFEAATALAAGRPVATVAAGTSWYLLLGAAAVGVLALLAWLAARSTVYSITTRRVVMRFGVALPMTVNLPYTVVESAALRAGRDGTGDLPLSLLPGSRVGYLVNWPHVRPWQFARPQPMLRAVPDAAAVAGLLSRSLAAVNGGTTTAVATATPSAAAAPAAGLSAAA
jgi:hypothetical protein